MKYNLNEQEMAQIFQESLQYLHQHLMDWNCKMTIDRNHYMQIKNKLKQNDNLVTYEEILTEMLFCGCEFGIWNMDNESDFTLFDMGNLKPNSRLLDEEDVLSILNGDGEYDIETTDRILQTLFFSGIKYI